MEMRGRHLTYLPLRMVRKRLISHPWATPATRLEPWSPTLPVIQSTFPQLVINWIELLLLRVCCSSDRTLPTRVRLTG